LPPTTCPPLWFLARDRSVQFRVRVKQKGEEHPKKSESGGNHPPRTLLLHYSGWLLVLSLLQLTAMAPVGLEEQEGEDKSGQAKRREHDLRRSVGAGHVAELAIEKGE